MTGVIVRPAHNRADDGQFVRHPRHLRQKFGNLNSGYGRVDGAKFAADFGPLGRVALTIAG